MCYRPAMTAQQHLDKIEAAISDLLDALLGDAVQEYTFNGRTYRRANFSTVLDTLYAQRTRLQLEVQRASGGSVRVVSFGSPRGVDR